MGEAINPPLGSVVRLKSGGPKMTVTFKAKLHNAPIEVTCSWFCEKSQSYAFHIFPDHSLVLAEKE